MDISGKACLITGATRGIGAATALELARRGGSAEAPEASEERRTHPQRRWQNENPGPPWCITRDAAFRRLPWIIRSCSCSTRS
jgi:NAD(P)-dependent dehydrogenase (short-subunit alcohol dehydrogenase family)